MKIVAFTESEMQQILTEAKKRNEARHKSYNDDEWQTLGNQPRLIRNIQGRMGEHAGARILGLPVQPAVLSSGTDDGIDATYNGQTVEFRFNPYPHGDFYVKKTKVLIADIGILITPWKGVWDNKTRTVAVKKWISRQNFESLYAVKSFGYGGKEVKAVSQQVMWDIETLLMGDDPGWCRDVCMLTFLSQWKMCEHLHLKHNRCPKLTNS